MNLVLFVLIATNMEIHDVRTIEYFNTESECLVRKIELERDQHSRYRLECEVVRNPGKIDG